MKEKDIKLFDKAIHEVKFLINDIAKEREEHHKDLEKMMRTHDKKINKMIKKSLKIINDLYELYNDLKQNNEEI